ncbi:MAG: hypothetical protein D6681_11765 [Calditrichaeota bacterium]|nr:MAG: hypothetical protein D6681_11765 [Calditrichota bacterium]
MMFSCAKRFVSSLLTGFQNMVSSLLLPPLLPALDGVGAVEGRNKALPRLSILTVDPTKISEADY